MANHLFLRLIHKIVTEDGTGHKELQEKVLAGEVTEEEQALIIMRANTIILKKKIEDLSEKVDVVFA